MHQLAIAIERLSRADRQRMPSSDHCSTKDSKIAAWQQCFPGEDCWTPKRQA
jgi:hypothetical protein